MKKYIILPLFTLMSVVALSQQKYQATVYLKNGTIIHNVIIQQFPDESILLKIDDTHSFIIQKDEILKMTDIVIIPMEEVLKGTEGPGQKASQTDSVQGYLHYKILKINPIQILFSEIPVSFEVFHKPRNSTQLQLGFIFPFPRDFPHRMLFESSGKNGDAKSEGLFSYRTSPYNNYGLSFKVEFRKYRRFLYYAPQLMYKYCFYKESTFPLYNGSITIDQTESKTSNIFGLGFIMGWQSFYGNFVLDRYVGVGLRVRSISVTVKRIMDSPRPIKYPNTTDHFESFYPFINLGIRIGIKL